MATYFHGSSGSSSENQASGELQTLYLMNPNYLFYPTSSSQNPPPSPPSSSMVFLNSSHAPPHMGVLPEDPSQSHLSFNYTPIDQSNNTQNFQPPPQMMIPISTVVGEDGFRRPPTSQQGLSLSLSSHQQGFYKPSSSIQMGDDSVQSVVFSSKYLRAVQELLDEVVNVGKGSDVKSDSGGGSKPEKKKKEIVREESDGGGTSDAKRGAELNTVQRQELQMKKAKLINMLDLVEQRYRQYHNQMQIVVASFEQASGLGSAKSYTSLALKTISKQFRCIKDTISAQIKAMSKDLGEDFGGLKGEGSSSSSRLRFIDQHLRQQRALQQLGMMQHNAWRPQRGLPERAVTVLRAWLFEHFLHPYPKDSDKHMLAKQTGLTRSQVSNWFINARVRLWKPMVEEMYLEEIKDQDQDGPSENASQNNVEANKKADGENSTKFEANAVQLCNREKPYISKNASPADDLSSSTLSTSPVGKSIQVHDSFNLIRGTSSDMGSVIHGHGSPKKLRRTDMQTMNSPSSILQMDIHEMKLSENNTKLEMLNRDHVYSLLSGGQNADTGTGFGTSYQPMGEIRRFNSDQIGPRFHGNGSVSLTLGPPPIENHLSLSASHQNYFPNQNIHEFGRRLEMGNGGADFFASNNNSQPSHSTSGFEELSMQSRKRFAAQLLPDYVA